MYALAQEISIDTIDPQLKSAADDVVDVLKDVVSLALASSDILQETRRRFTVLTNVLAGAPEMEQFVTFAGSSAEQEQELLCQILEKVANRTAHELPATRTMKSDEADKEGVSKGMVKDTIKEVGNSREKVEDELDCKK